MSKAMVKCPSCGKQVPAAMRYCGWCGVDMKIGKSERVEPLTRPDRPEEKPQQTVRQPAQQSVQQPAQQPAQQSSRPQRPVQQPKSAQGTKSGPARRPAEPPQKPVNPSRRPAAASSAVPPHRKNTGKIIALLAAAAVIIIIAVVLIVKPGSAGDSEEAAPEENGVHLVNVDGTEVESGETEDAGTGDAETGDEEQPEEEVEPTDSPEPAETEDGVEEVSDTVYVTGSGVNLRTGPGTTYDVVASLARGTALERTGITNGWSRVMYEGAVCYVSSALISDEEPESDGEDEPAGENETAAEGEAAGEEETGGTIVVAVAEANIRSGAGTGYDIVGTVEKGTELERTGVTGNWSIVIYNGEERYISTSLIAEKGESGTVTVVSEANVRSGPGTSYDILGVVKVGTVLTATDHTASNWYEVEYDGQTGYIAGNMVQEN